MVVRRNIYRGVYHQKGNGVGSILSGLFRLLTPFIKKGAKAALRSQPVKRALKSAKRSALKTAATAATDLIAGKNPKQNAKINLHQAQRDIEKAIINPPQKLKRKNRGVTKPKNNKIKRVIIAPSQGSSPSKKSRPLI